MMFRVSKYVLLIIIIISTLVLFNCRKKKDKPDDWAPFSFPYDSIKAGAEIIESINLNSLLDIERINGKKNHSEIVFSKDNNNFYFVKKSKIVIFSGKPLKKNYEIKINLQEIHEEGSNPEDIIVFDNKILIIYHLNNKEPPCIMVQMILLPMHRVLHL